jgi:hypothetical protein
LSRIRQFGAVAFNGGWNLDELEGGMAAEELLALAALAGQTVVAAAATDVWGKAKQGFARLLGRGNQSRVEVAERRLERTREQLASVPAAEVEAARVGPGIPKLRSAAR